jgi:hypothetical protein
MNTIPSDLIPMILLRSQPVDVVKLRQASSRVFRTNHFVTLMQAHYPHAVLTSDPKKQYLALTRGFVTYYKIENGFQANRIAEIGSIVRMSCSYRGIPKSSYDYPYVESSETIPLEMSIDLASDEDLPFQLAGLVVPLGTIMWFAISTEWSSYEVVVKKTREELAVYISDQRLDFLTTLVQMFMDDTGGEAFDDTPDEKVAESYEFNSTLEILLKVSI